MGTKLPGPGTVYVKQVLNFLASVHISDTITARVEITEIIHQKNRMELKTCVNLEKSQKFFKTPSPLHVVWSLTKGIVASDHGDHICLFDLISHLKFLSVFVRTLPS